MRWVWGRGTARRLEASSRALQEDKRHADPGQDTMLRLPAIGRTYQRGIVAILSALVVLIVVHLKGTSSCLGFHCLQPTTPAPALTTPPAPPTAPFIPFNSMHGNSDQGLHEALRHYAIDDVIILSSVDSSYVDMATNLWMTSLTRFHLDNYLFIGSDSSVCGYLHRMTIHCFEYIHDRDASKESSYFSAAFKRKTHLKTKIILEALTQGMTVLIMDVDIVLFKNPFPYLNCTTCDIQIQYDVTEANSGFYLARPTSPSLKLHERALRMSRLKKTLSNQKTLDRTMEAMIKANAIKVKTLSNAQFPNGQVYFEAGHRMFRADSACAQCVLVHNNWIVSGAAKVFRFKEMGLWEVDKLGYFSDPKRLYLKFDNVLDVNPAQLLPIETSTLKAALVIGRILNRTVILPSFHCDGCSYGACRNQNNRCSFHTFYKILEFDLVFGAAYREHVFLDHPSVPDSVKQSASTSVFIRNAAAASLFAQAAVSPPDNTTTLTFTPTSMADGPAAEEVLHWFTEPPFAAVSVLRFHSLYGVLAGLQRQPGPHTDFIHRLLHTAFVPADYRQFGV